MNRDKSKSVLPNYQKAMREAKSQSKLLKEINPIPRIVKTDTKRRIGNL